MMSAIVLDDEQHEQGEKKREPIGPRNAQVHQVPKAAEWQQRVDDLPAALELIGPLVLGYDVGPGGVLPIEPLQM